MTKSQPSYADDPGTYIAFIRSLQSEDFQAALQIPLIGAGDEGIALNAALRELAQSLAARASHRQKLDAITARFNAGFLLEEILENVYQDFRQIIPYNRLGLALIEDHGQMVRACWVKSDQPEIAIHNDYTASLEGSSLKDVLHTGSPRILNDLVGYLEENPNSESTRLIVQEGIRSSLTCPLVAHGKPVGFFFFSSVLPNTYANSHIETFQSIANQLAAVVERGRLVSELANQKAAYEAQNQELLRLNELKNILLGVAAHDLRTPIGNIQMGASLLMDRQTWQSENDRLAFLETFLPTLGRQTRHMMTLLDDLLDISMIEAGKLRLEYELIELDSFLAEVVERHAQMAISKGTRVVLEDVPQSNIHADPNRLVQVMDNLISNAVKYSPPGSTVRVSVESTGEGWRFRIQDEGPGISESDRQNLFLNFARLSARPTGGEKSTGLGLAITRRIVEAHGGQIGVHSPTDGGAIFWFTLPRL